MACSTARLAIDYSKVPADWVGYVEYLDNDPHFNTLPKVDGLDVFSGCQMFTRMWTEKHLHCLSLDILQDEVNHNIQLPEGVQTFIMQAMRMKRGRGMAALGPPCKPWIWLTSSQTRRTGENPAGDETNWLTQEPFLSMFWFSSFLM